MEEREETLSLAFAALADPSRRRIMDLLRETPELRVGDIAGAFAMSLNGVSKHLKVLEKAGLVERRIEGRVHWLRVCPDGLLHPQQWLDGHHQYWSRRLDGLVDVLEAGNDKEG